MFTPISLDTGRVAESLKTLAFIAEKYEQEGLDEHRPSWPARPFSKVVLLSGRGGADLLTLQDCFDAREALKSLEEALNH